MTKPKKPFLNNVTTPIFTALIGAGATILVAVIGKLGCNSPAPCPPTTVNTLQQDTGTQNLVNQNENKGQIKNEFVSGNKTNNNYKVVDSSKPVEIKGKNVNTGTNNGIIGDNSTLVKEERFHPDKIILDKIVAALNTKQDFISISYDAGQQKKNREYAIELGNKLILLGYKNVQLRDDMIMRNNPDKKVDIISANSGYLSLFVDLY